MKIVIQIGVLLLVLSLLLLAFKLWSSPGSCRF